MEVLLDGERLFGGRVLSVEAGSPERGRVRRSAAGLDGEVAIDLGCRGRGIVQRGIMEALSSESLHEKVVSLERLVGGCERRLEAGGRVFEPVVVESFRAGSFSIGKSGVCCEYEMVYRQSVVGR